MAGAARPAGAGRREPLDRTEAADFVPPAARPEAARAESAADAEAQAGLEAELEAEAPATPPQAEGEIEPAAYAQAELEAELEAEPAGAAPPQIADLAAACVRFVRARYAATLDFSPVTLSFVDQWIRDASRERKGRAELTDLVQSAAGAYLGEVVRRAFGGTWFVPAEDVSGWRLYLSTVYCSFNPIGMAREAILLEPADGWYAHFEVDPAEKDAIERRLAALPAVEDAEFYAPSTRFDVVEIVVHALRGAMVARGLAGVRFAPEDYR